MGECEQTSLEKLHSGDYPSPLRAGGVWFARRIELRRTTTRPQVEDDCCERLASSEYKSLAKMRRGAMTANSRSIRYNCKVHCNQIDTFGAGYQAC
jgi:hypothetical protein